MVPPVPIFHRPVLLLVLALLAACASHVQDPSPTEDPVPLRIASDLDNPPFARVDDQGRPRGRDVEMMELLCAEAGFEPVWVRLPFDALLPTLEAGQVDAVCATLGVTPERAERVAFTRPYFRTAIALVTRLGPDEPQRHEDLDGRPVSAAPGTTSERALRSHLPDALPAAPPSNEPGKDTSTEARLLAGELDAAIMDAPAAEALIARHPDRLRRLLPDLDEELYSIAVRPGAPWILERLDTALARLEARGDLEALDRRHGLR